MATTKTEMGGNTYVLQVTEARSPTLLASNAIYSTYNAMILTPKLAHNCPCLASWLMRILESHEAVCIIKWQLRGCDLLME